MGCSRDAPQTALCNESFPFFSLPITCLFAPPKNGRDPLLSGVVTARWGDQVRVQVASVLSLETLSARVGQLQSLSCWWAVFPLLWSLSHAESLQPISKRVLRFSSYITTSSCGRARRPQGWRVFFWAPQVVVGHPPGQGRSLSLALGSEESRIHQAFLQGIAWVFSCLLV